MERDILEAAARVLAEQGAAAFTTNRVAERAGISVGSLYQYYPNRAALLLRLSQLENADTLAQLSALLADDRRTPRERVIAAVRAFFASEAAEAPMRSGLDQARVSVRESPEFGAVERAIVARVTDFLATAGAPGRDAAFDAALVATVVSSVAERLTSGGMLGAEMERWADACSAMLCDYLGLACNPGGAR